MQVRVGILQIAQSRGTEHPFITVFFISVIVSVFSDLECRLGMRYFLPVEMPKKLLHS